ncbi:DUF599 domain-containing protein [Rhodobacteraceae bacterium HSP-20]|uniref:DUF599 domain-containing protein n=1 Tax=Paragemmobacter amnigenus TaxID=2852097 RepID=A0ABS6J3S0_9RHOB|nr:DUF599 domain-containing protein [Rhodobacter amnigenus]MBU9697077.1 DUF599 domain-containing protein [Rhodobacter amnigenus]MBV4388304.1 DUF599 domain-containing protein [Rhodobacter amnigenus]
MIDHLGALTAPDFLAVLAVLALWAVSGWVIEHPPARRPSVSLIMQDYRRDWMRQFVTRQPRIFDATLIDSLRQGTAFFASASMIAIGGGVALIGNSDRLRGLAQDLTLAADTMQVELKIILALAFLANALLKFVWAHRLFGYCSILMAAVPNDAADPTATPRAAQAAEINITAAKNFNRGLRSIYYALAALGWLFGPAGLVLAGLASTTVLLRREFASQSRDVMLSR